MLSMDNSCPCYCDSTDQQQLQYTQSAEAVAIVIMNIIRMAKESSSI